jgi:hypothetical protein
MRRDDTWTADRMGDLSGRTVVVTGANSGLGFEATRAFARAGAHVVLACRSRTRGTLAKQSITRETPDASLAVRTLDLASLSSVRRFAERFDAEALDLLVNNAGVMAIPRRTTEDGFETQFGVNHLGHFALTGLLLDRLVAGGGARVVTVSSAFHRRGEVDFDDLQHADSYGPWEAYAQSKLANLLFAYELQRRLDDADLPVTSVAAHPGYAATNLQLRGPQMRDSPVRTALNVLANRLFAQNAEMGALPILYAATAPAVSGGDYVGPDSFRGLRGYPTVTESSDRSRDPDLARDLWRVSASLTGVTFDFERVAADA